MTATVNHYNIDRNSVKEGNYDNYDFIIMERKPTKDDSLPERVIAEFLNELIKNDGGVLA